MKLIIKQLSWPEESSNYKEDDIETKYDVNLNEKYIIKTAKVSYKKGKKWVEEEREVFSFNVVELNDDNIKIHTYQPFSDNQDDTIDLFANKHDFTITDVKPLKLVTPTTDCGYTFIIKIDNK